MTRGTIALAFHIFTISFMLLHISEVINWPLLVKGWYWFLLLLPIPFFSKRVRAIYSLFLIYSFVTFTIYNGWPLSLFKLPVSDHIALAVMALLSSLVYMLAARSYRAGLIFLCCVTGLYLHYHFSLASLFIHEVSVAAFLISLFQDLHWLYWPINQLLLLYRRLNKVV